MMNFAAIATTSVILSTKEVKMKNHHYLTAFPRTVLHSAFRSVLTTARHKFVSCGSFLDFTSTCNRDKHAIFVVVIPTAEIERMNYKFGAPDRKGPKIPVLVR